MEHSKQFALLKVSKLIFKSRTMVSCSLRLRLQGVLQVSLKGALLVVFQKNLEGELFNELPPTQKQTNKLAAYMKWRRNKLEMAGTTARCLFSIAPEIVDQDRDIFLEAIKLVE